MQMSGNKQSAEISVILKVVLWNLGKSYKKTKVLPLVVLFLPEQPSDAAGWLPTYTSFSS